MDNKRAIISACCLFSMFAVLISGIVSLTESREEEKKNRVYIVNSSTQSIPKEENLGEENGYLVKDQDGKLAVFNSINTDTPIRTTDIYVDSLRRYDQDLLKEGITVYGEEALSMILEDFGS